MKLIWRYFPLKQDKIVAKQGIMIQSVERALNIIILIGESSQPLSAAEISKQTGINRTTVYALLNTLESKKFIIRDSNTGFYRIGPIPYQIGLAFQNHSVLISSMEKNSRMFAEKWKLSARLGIYNGVGKLLLLLIESPYEVIGFPFRTGMTFPMHATAMGKTLLAHFEPQELNTFLDGYSFFQYTPFTVADINKLKDDLEQIRRQKYSLDHNEYVDGLSCVAVPVYDANNKVIAAVSLSGDTSKIKRDLKDIIHDAQLMAQFISLDLGWKL
jgi:DNA-binding IclR family transcriptional regulator